MPETASEADAQAFAALAVGDPAALSAALAEAAGPGSPILLLPSLPTPGAAAGLARLVDRAAEGSGRPRPDRLRPATGLAAGIAAPGPWASLPTAPGADRFHEALLPARLSRREAVVISGIGGGFAESPCGLLASFAHPRQRLALRLGGDPAPAAELAAAVKLRAALLAGERDGVHIAGACSTLLAAQLLWRALQPRRPGSETPEPWEQPEVQRLTALDQAPRLPAALEIVIHGSGPAAAAVARLLRERLGDVSLRNAPQ